MALVVPGVTRFTILQELEGEEVANILDVRIDTTGTVTDRDDAIADQAEVIADNWVDHIMPNLVDDLSITGVQWLDLDSSTGSTGTFTGSASVTLPAAGGDITAPLPANVSALVRKSLETSGRGRRAGRMYLAGLGESATGADNGNILDPLVVSGFNGLFASFKSGVNQEGTGIVEYDSAICVVHVTSRDSEGRPLTGISSDVSTLTVDPLLATQRRRLRR